MAANTWCASRRGNKAPTQSHRWHIHTYTSDTFSQIHTYTHFFTHTRIHTHRHRNTHNGSDIRQWAKTERTTQHNKKKQQQQAYSNTSCFCSHFVLVLGLNLSDTTQHDTSTAITHELQALKRTQQHTTKRHRERHRTHTGYKHRSQQGHRKQNGKTANFKNAVLLRNTCTTRHCSNFIRRISRWYSTTLAHLVSNFLRNFSVSALLCQFVSLNRSEIAFISRLYILFN